MFKAYAVTLLRIVIGGHIFYEGLFKLMQPGGWSAEGFLRTSPCFVTPVFRFVASTPWLLTAVNQTLMWGLTLVGLMLILGLLTRTSATAGFAFLAFSFVVRSPFLAPFAREYLVRVAGEAVAIIAVVLMPSYGLDRFLASLPRKAFKRKLEQEKSNHPDE